MTWTRICGVGVAAAVTAVLGLAAAPVHAQAPPPAVTGPVVTILVPTVDPTTSTSTATIDLGGTTDDPDAVIEVTWSNARGGHGFAEGTRSWFVTGIPLQPGWNELSVTARNGSGQTAAARLAVEYVTSEPPASAPRPRDGGAHSSFTILAAPTVNADPGVTSTPRAATAPASVAAPQAVDGLVAAYNFDESSGTTAADASGNGNTGTLSGGVTRTPQGRFGRALVFNGSAFVTVPPSASLDLTSAMTLEAWVYPTATPVGATTALMKEQAGHLAYALYAGGPTGRPGTGFTAATAPGAERSAHGPLILPLHTWTHLAGTLDGTSLRLYVNGVLAATRDVAGPITVSTGPLRIGGNAVWGEYFRGRIDDVRIYNRALSQVEVRRDMATPVGPSAPSVVGQWAGPFDAPIVAIHGTVLRTGQVLLWDVVSGANRVQLWQPATNTFVPADDPQTNIFCAGHCALPDGRILVAGGHVSAHLGLADANLFDPVTGGWERVSSMHRARWYPTATTLPDGRLLVTAGEDGCFGCFVEIPEIYDPSTGAWTLLSNAVASLPFYPHMFVLPDGRVLAASTTEDTIVTRVLDVATQTWSVVDPVPVDGGSAVMYVPGKVMKAGLGVDSDVPVIPSVATTYVLDMTKPAPAWQETAAMAFPRTYHNLTLLPDGQVLVTGGGDTTDAIGLEGAILPAELWSPATRTWTTLAAMQKPRLYHSIALLLPDARVLVAGGGKFSGPSVETDQFNLEVFSPPYLFKGPRPTITTAPPAASYGAVFAVQTPDAARIASVALVKPGSVTHSFNADQRYVPLAFTVAGGGLSVQAPANANLAPPGHYMLFIVDTAGVPSVAKFVRLP